MKKSNLVIMAESEDRAGRERTLTLEPKHNIFMSHSGAQKEFTHQFSLDLYRAGHFPFFDKWSDCLPKGERFAKLIFEAAEQCSMAVVVLSPEYMTAKWPMMELNAFYIAQTSTRPELILFPVFYKLEPRDLSDTSKLDAWEEEWRKHQKEDTLDRIDIESWRKAVRQLRGINGLRFPDFGGSEVSYRAGLVKEVYGKLKPCWGYDLSGIQGCNRLCEIVEGMFEASTNGNAQGVQMLGLYGMGGVGKTTMCKALCNRFQHRFQGRVCHVELGPREKYLDLQKKVLKKLTNLGDQALQNITDSDEAQLQMKRRMRGQDVFLAVDNVEDAESSRQQAQDFLKCTFSAGSKVLVTGRSSIVVRNVLGRDEQFICKPVPNVDAIEALSIFLDKAGPGKSITSLSAEEKSVVCKCAEQACFSRKYHPLALRALASYYYEVDARNPLCWQSHLDDIHKLRLCRESESGTIFQILGLGFGKLPKATKLLFLDVALFIPPRRRFLDITTIEWLSAMHGEETSTIKRKLKTLERMTYLNEFGEDFGHITVHDLYREFAEWHIAQSSEEDANKATCIYNTGGERLPTMFKKRRSGNCWEELSRVFLGGLREVKTLPPHSNEWANVVVLHLEKCPDLTSLNLQGMECLQHLWVACCESLEKVEVGVGEESLPSLQYLQLDNNQTLKSIPGIGQCGELVCMKIHHCPELFLQSIGVEACPKLERLSTKYSCWTGLAKVALTQNLKVLRVDGSAGRSFNFGILSLASVQESGLNEASHSVFELDLNKYGSEAQPRKKPKVVFQYGRNLRRLDLSNLSMKNFKIVDSLSGLQSLRFDEVELLDEDTLCLEACVNLEELRIKGGNVQTISGIGLARIATLRIVKLSSMKNLWYLPDIVLWNTILMEEFMGRVPRCKTYILERVIRPTGQPHLSVRIMSPPTTDDVVSASDEVKVHTLDKGLDNLGVHRALSKIMNVVANPSVVRWKRKFWWLEQFYTNF